MTPGRLGRLAAVAVAWLVVVASGIYVVVDLSRWEWNRAMMTGIFFLAGLVVLTSMAVVRGQRRIEERLDALERATSGEPPGVRDVEARRAERHFAWMRRPPEGLGVFIPVLLGAGVVLSLLAYAIERIAGALFGPAIDDRTLERLAGELPLGRGPVRAVDPTPRVTRRGGLTFAVGLVVMVAMAGVSIEVLRDRTQTRAHELSAPGTTTLVVEVRQRRTPRPVEAVAADLVAACRSRLPGTVDVTDLERIGADTVRIELDTALGRTGQQRLVGCIRDHTLDLVLAEVVHVDVDVDVAAAPS